MSTSHYILIIALAIAAFSLRAIGLYAGSAIRTSKHSWVLEEIPGLILVSLVASSLAGQPLWTWIAAAAALTIAHLTNHVILTMIAGVLVYAGFRLMGF